jgi:acyl carrier protein/NRPS condensation-like uncharacterized protein
VSEIDTTLAGIWSEVLNIDQKFIGLDSGFFKLGGHSLKAFILVLKIQKEFNIKLSSTQIFKSPTIRELSFILLGNVGKNDESIEPTEKKEYFEITGAQESIWLHSLMEREGTLYNIIGAYTICGDIDKTKFKKAFENIVDRHEILKANIFKIDGYPKLRINPHQNIEFNYLDFREEVNREKQVENEIIDEINRVFNLENDPLYHATLVRMEEKRYILILNFHHLIMDGWSVMIFISEFFAIYSTLTGDTQLPIFCQHIDYKDYMVWQKTGQHEKNLKKSKDYWCKQLKGNIPYLNLPLDKSRPAVRSFKGEIVRLEIEKEIYERIKDLSKRKNVTLFTFFITTVFILLHKYSGQRDIIIGIDVLGRTLKNVDQIVGLFANTLPIKIEINPDEPFERLLHRVMQMVLTALDHQDYPFNRLVSELGLKRKSGRSPVFDVMVSLNNFGNRYLENESLKVTEFPLQDVLTKTHFDLSFDFEESPGKICGFISYAADLFSKEFIQLMSLRLLALLNDLSENYGSKIIDFNLISGIENNVEDSLEIDFNI